ncbi:MAG: DHH family phosphoesterase [Brumimicrobium sp.]
MQTFNEQKTAQLDGIINDSKHIVIVAHKSPDGDSIGSSVGLYQYLKKKNKSVVICHPDPAPSFLNWIIGVEDILNFEEHEKLVTEHFQKADTIFCLDFNDFGRVGNGIRPLLEKSKATKIMIDHHLYPSDVFDLQFSEVAACSTAQLIYDGIEALGDVNLIDELVGEPLYCGIMTDSGSFRFPSTTPHTHEVIAGLMRAGVKNYKVHEAVFDTNTLDRLRLRGYATNEKLEILEKYNVAIISLTKNELDKFNYVKGDTEGLVNVGLSIQGITKSIFLIEGEGIIKISFRSKGEDNPINEMASTYFSGGGHANASGGKWDGNMEEAIKKIKEVLPEFC